MQTLAHKGWCSMTLNTYTNKRCKLRQSVVQLTNVKYWICSQIRWWSYGGTTYLYFIMLCLGLLVCIFCLSYDCICSYIYMERMWWIDADVIKWRNIGEINNWLFRHVQEGQVNCVQEQFSNASGQFCWIRQSFLDDLFLFCLRIFFTNILSRIWFLNIFLRFLILIANWFYQSFEYKISHSFQHLFLLITIFLAAAVSWTS